MNLEMRVVNLQIGNDLYRKAFLIVNDNSTINDPIEWMTAVKWFKKARHITNSPTIKSKCKKMIKFCLWRAAGVKDYTASGIGYYFGEQSITKSEAIRIINEYKKRINGTQYIPIGRGSSLARVRNKNKQTIRDIVFQLFDEVKLDPNKRVIQFYKETLKLVLAHKPNSKFDEKHFSYYVSLYKNAKKNGN